MDFIRTHRHRFGVESICAVLTEHGITIAPSTFYDHQARGFGPTDAELNEAYTAHRLYCLWQDNRCVYGRRNCGNPPCATGSISAVTRSNG